MNATTLKGFMALCGKAKDHPLTFKVMDGPSQGLGAKYAELQKVKLMGV